MFALTPSGYLCPPSVWTGLWVRENECLVVYYCFNVDCGRSGGTLQCVGGLYGQQLFQSPEENYNCHVFRLYVFFTSRI